MSQVMRTSLFSATAKGWWSYHLSVRYIPHFLHISQCTRRATLSWRFLYSLWASLLHPLIICLTVSVEFPHNLHSGVSEVLSMLCLIEFVLKACSWAARIKHCLLLPKPSQGIFSSYICCLSHKVSMQGFLLPVPDFLLLHPLLVFLEILFFI